MRWFGGFIGPTTAPREPVDVRRACAESTRLWLVGSWPDHEVQLGRTRRGPVAVIGSCSASPHDVSSMASHGVLNDVVLRWPGSYVVLEVTDATTTIWTDVGGAWPIYTVSADGGTYWASSSRALAGLTGAHPDLDRLAAWLVAPFAPVLLNDRSAFAGITLAPPGHRLTLHRNGTRTARRTWIPRARDGSPAARLRTELAAAVTVRMDTARRPTLDLSGGYDSTALAMLAAEHSSTDRPVTAVTVHPATITTGGDLTHAREAATRCGITHRLYPLDAEHAPYSQLNAVPITDEPAPSTIAHARFAGQLAWMRDTLGTDCHLTGDGGDSLLCSPPVMLADLIATRQGSRALAETIKWARLRRLSVWPLLVAACRTARISRPDALRSLAGFLQTGQPGGRWDGDVRWFLAQPPPAWATPTARERASALTTRVADHISPVPAGSFTTTAITEAMADVGRTARADVQLAEHVGVPLHNPFIDSRVIDAYLSVSLKARPGPAHYKPILRDAMADLFPAALAARVTKGDFNADHYAGMRHNLADLHALADGQLAALGLVDPAALRRTLTLTASGLPVAFSTVEPAIAAEVWLRALATAPPVEWVEARPTESAA